MAIIVKTYGGLGNQLFQYAFARAVASKLKTDFRLDVDLTPIYAHLKIHPYALGYFNTRIEKAADSDMWGFVWLRRRKKFFNFAYRHMRLKRKLLPFYYPEKTFAFDLDVFNQGDPTYFDGFWQTGRYFESIADEIRQEITLKEPLSPYSREIEGKIKKEETPISLHVRRGFYVSDATSSAFHGVCSPEYYEAAIRYITERVKNPHFFIFSDDYPWAAENFKTLQYPHTCINNPEALGHEDMTLMSKCHHHIIANSSFSWWGSWLNPRKDKIVIAPKKWFANAPKNDTRDLFPENWIKM
ncbi:MAG: alpha-1,2-fucosyltransferase [bacterium]|nr:alpha-1,2-fucosyltransferase [bacterium]